MKAFSDDIEPPHVIHNRITRLTDNLAEALDAQKEQGGSEIAIRIQRLQRLREQEQKKIKPYLATGKSYEDPHRTE